MSTLARLRSANQAFGRSRSEVAFLTQLGGEPPEPTACTAIDVGTITTLNNFSTWNITPCDTGSGIVYESYRTTWATELTCLIRDCSQGGYQVTGRRSGITWNFDIRDKLLFQPSCNIPCVVLVAGGQYNGGGLGQWSGSPTNRWLVGGETYVLAPVGFFTDECIDLTITACWSLPITEVSPDPVFSTLPMLTVVDHRLEPEMRVIIEDSALYDGGWQVLFVRNANQFTLGGPGASYLGNDTGTLRPWFDYKEFDSQLTVGAVSPDYGFQSGSFGDLTPVNIAGEEVTKLYGQADFKNVFVETAGQAPFFGNNNIFLRVEGAPCSPYEIVQTSPGVGTYESNIPELADYLVAQFGNTIGVSIDSS